MKNITLCLALFSLLFWAGPVMSAQKVPVQQKAVQQAVLDSAQTAKFGSMLKEAMALQEKARVLTSQFNQEYNLLIDQRVREMTDSILANVFRKEYTPSGKKKGFMAGVW